MLMSVKQLADFDQRRAVLRDLTALVIGLHEHAARSAVRVALTFDLGGVEVLIGHDANQDDQVVVVVEGPNRRIFLLPAEAFGALPFADSSRFTDQHEAVGAVLAALADDHG